MGYAKLIKNYSPTIIKLNSTTQYNNLSDAEKNSDITYIIANGANRPEIKQKNFNLTGTTANYQGASSTAAGIPGLVPSASISQRNNFLRGDGTWVIPTNTTYAVVSTAANGLVPKVTSTAAFLKGNGTWATPTNTTYAKASTSADGLMPKLAGGTAKYLRADGTWATPTNTTYAIATTAANGLMSASDKDILNNLNLENNNGQATRSSHPVIKNFDFFNSGARGSTFYVWKKGNIATLIIDFTSANSSSISLTWQNLNDYSGYTSQSDGHLMAQLPNGFYPKKRIAANLTPNHLASTGTDFPQITLTTNGGVYLCTYTGTMKGGRAVITYIC